MMPSKAWYWENDHQTPRCHEPGSLKLPTLGSQCSLFLNFSLSLFLSLFTYQPCRDRREIKAELSCLIAADLELPPKPA